MPSTSCPICNARVEIDFQPVAGVVRCPYCEKLFSPAGHVVTLTDEQKELLILMGKPDDGSQDYVVPDGERITMELVKLGLVYCAGKDSTGRQSYDLTNEGERVYGELTGEDVS
jgi:hypothetical protein